MGNRAVWSVQRTVCFRGQVGEECGGKRAIWPSGEGATQRGEKKREAGGRDKRYEHSV